MPESIKTARGAVDNKTQNVIRTDTALILFDQPGDNSSHKTFELSREGGKKLSQIANIEQISGPKMVSLNGTVLANGYVAVRFDGVSTGTYKLTRSDGRAEPEVIFEKRPKDHLTGTASHPGFQQHNLITLAYDYKEATDEDLKGIPEFIHLIASNTEL